MLVPVLLDSPYPFSPCLLPECHWLPPKEQGWKISASLVPVYFISSEELMWLQNIVVLCQPWVLTYHSCTLSMLASSPSLHSTPANSHTLFYVKKVSLGSFMCSLYVTIGSISVCRMSATVGFGKEERCSLLRPAPLNSWDQRHAQSCTWDQLDPDILISRLMKEK